MRTSSSTPSLRAAVEAALADAARAYVVRGDAVPSLAAERGALIVAERAAAPATEAAAGISSDARERRFRDALSEAGGGLLIDAIRRDDTGAARRALRRAAWLPDLATCLAIQSLLPPGWIVVTRDGAAVVDDLAVRLGAPESVLERRAEATRLAGELTRLETDVTARRRRSPRPRKRRRPRGSALESARQDEARAGSARRDAEERERLAARDLEAAVRESAWAAAQAERLDGETARAAAALAILEAPVASPGVERGSTAASGSGADGGPDASAAIGTWEARAGELRARRDRLAEEAAARDAGRRDAESRRARAEAAAGLGEERMVRTDGEAARLEERAGRLAAEREQLRSEVAAATSAEQAARAALAELHAADAAQRERLAAAERAAAGTRDRLRVADERLRLADRDDLEARLALDALRESIVVDLAGLGEIGVARLAAVSGMTAPVDAMRGRRPARRRRNPRSPTPRGPSRTPLSMAATRTRISRRRWRRPSARRRRSGPRPRRPRMRRRAAGSRSCDDASTSSVPRTRSPSRSTPRSRGASRRSRRRPAICGPPSPGRASSSPSSSR